MLVTGYRRTGGWYSIRGLHPGHATVGNRPWYILVAAFVVYWVAQADRNGISVYYAKYNLGNNLEKWNYLKGAKDILRKEGTPHEYHFREGAIAFPDGLDKPARTMLTSEGSLNRSTHVIEDPKSKCYRILTPVETERINGFPDNWTNTGMPERFRYFCMGNALVVGLIEKMGNRLNKIFESEED